VDPVGPVTPLVAPVEPVEPVGVVEPVAPVEPVTPALPPELVDGKTVVVEISWVVGVAVGAVVVWTGASGVGPVGELTTVGSVFALTGGVVAAETVVVASSPGTRGAR
jgi:hypothetical protein